MNVVGGAGGINGSTRPKGERTVPERTVLYPNVSLPVKSCRTVALDLENTECPEKYPGNEGVRLLPGLYGIHFSVGYVKSVGWPGPPQAVTVGTCPVCAR